MVLGTFPEINGLAADPPGRGVGRLLIAAAEETASSSGARLVGMAVAHTNTRARRLYERLGYEEWGHGQVIDDWDERDVDGAITVVHHDECAYLTKTVG